MENLQQNKTSNKEIEIRYGFIANKEFAKEFFENAIITEVAYLVPFGGSDSNTTCRFRRRNGKSTITCKTTDGKNGNFMERYEDEIEITNESFEAYTEKLPIMKFRFYKDKLGREFKTFDEPGNERPKFIAEKEFDHIPTIIEYNEFANSLTKLGHSIYDITDNNAMTMMQRYNDFLKKNNYIS